MTAIGRAVELTNRFFRCFSAPNICTSSQAVDDFAAIVNGSLEAEGLLRFAGHVSQCLACRDMLVTLIMATGLRRVLRAGLQELVGVPAASARDFTVSGRTSDPAAHVHHFREASRSGAKIYGKGRVEDRFRGLTVNFDALAGRLGSLAPGRVTEAHL